MEGSGWADELEEESILLQIKQLQERDLQEGELLDELIQASRESSLNVDPAQRGEFSSSLFSPTPKPCMSKRQHLGEREKAGE